MDFDEFIDALYKAGWKAPNDAQHTNIREVWVELIEKGLRIQFPLKKKGGEG